MSDMLPPEVATSSTSFAKNPFPSIGTIMIWTSVGRGEELIELRRPLRMQLHDVASANALEETLDVCVAETDAPVGLGGPDRRRPDRHALDRPEPERLRHPRFALMSSSVVFAEEKSNRSAKR